MSSRLERLLHFVTSHSARDVPKVGIGSDCDSPRFENMARKLPVKFRLLEAAGRHWILTTLKRPLSLGRSDGSLLSGADVHGAR